MPPACPNCDCKESNETDPSLNSKRDRTCTKCGYLFCTERDDGHVPTRIMSASERMTKNAEMSGSIRGISRNLLGGPDSILSVIHPHGILGEIRRSIEKGNITDALKYLEEAEKMSRKIMEYSDNIII